MPRTDYKMYNDEFVSLGEVSHTELLQYCKEMELKIPPEKLSELIKRYRYVVRIIALDFNCYSEIIL